jgi:hypothetical protein
VDAQAGAVDEDGLTERGESVGGLAARDVGDVEGLDLGSSALAEVTSMQSRTRVTKATGTASTASPADAPSTIHTVMLA